jgi:hypothetical protein
MTIERPMFPPRAESVHAFSNKPAVGQPDTETLASESPGPANGLSRRSMLGAIAVLPALPVAAVAAEPDPIFALIEAKRAADIAHGDAITMQDRADTQFGFDSDESFEADERCEAACYAAHDAAWQLARTAPISLAGVVAVLRFANQLEDEGMEWPDTDRIGAEGWHYRLRATIAQAIEAIIGKGGAA